MAETSYTPTSPVRFRSGKHKDESLDLLMFKDPQFLHWWFRKCENKAKGVKPTNRMHMHLRWLIDKAETVEPTALCRYCRIRPVRYYSVRTSSYEHRISIDPRFTTCENSSCRNQLLSQDALGDIVLHKLSFAEIFNYLRTCGKLSNDSKRDMSALLCFAYELPQRLSAQICFNFFSNI